MATPSPPPLSLTPLMRPAQYLPVALTQEQQGMEVACGQGRPVQHFAARRPEIVHSSISYWPGGQGRKGGASRLSGSLVSGRLLVRANGVATPPSPLQRSTLRIATPEEGWSKELDLSWCCQTSLYKCLAAIGSSSDLALHICQDVQVRVNNRCKCSIPQRTGRTLRITRLCVRRAIIGRE